MAFKGIQRYLKSITGLDVNTVGAAVVERAVRRRMDLCNTAQVSQYERLMKTSTAELQALINEISVPETWFFRDEKPFELLSQLAREYAVRHQAGPPLRVLSIPCSTGEEPYSIAMTLLDAGYGPEQFSIDAVDISTAVIEVARKGAYGRNSFRGEQLDYRQRYFTAQGNHYLVHEVLKSSISFQQGNIVADGFMASQAPYHVIFCRNLLIYFGVENKTRSLQTLHRLLASDGVLFLGHAETGRMADGLFEPAGVAGTFAYHKLAGGKPDSACAGVDLSTPPKWSSRKAVDAAARRVGAPGSPRAAAPSGTATRAPVTPPPSDGMRAQAAADPSPEVAQGRDQCLEQRLAEIEQLADRGELVQAARQCDQLLSERPDAFRGYYLKGMIHLAGEEDEAAMAAFRKALYLMPDHYPTLVQLSVLAQRRGDDNAAQNYRARAQRIAQEVAE